MTGGSGFIGTHLINKLIRNNEEVICIDNFETSSILNLKKWENNHNFQLIKHDIVTPIEFEVDRIWHLASPASPKKYLKDPIKTLRTNFLGTYNVLNLATKYNSKILLASSSEIYGNPKVHPQKETYFGEVDPIGPRSCYKEGKRVAESLFSNFCFFHNTNIRIARIFNTYGSGMLPNDGRVVSNFIYQALKKESLTVYGKGIQTRTFCYIKDLIDGLLLMMNSDYKKPINLGGSEEISILKLAQIIRKKINPKIDIIFKNLPQDDPLKRKPDLFKAKNILNWEAQINLNDGLDITIEKLSRAINK